MRPLTHEERRASQARKLDGLCLDCGEGFAGGGPCFACRSENVKRLIHGSEGWTHCLAGGGGAIGVKRDTSAARAAQRERR